jgi:hypothetical protein
LTPKPNNNTTQLNITTQRTMTFISFPAPASAEWPGTMLNLAERPASAPPGPSFEANDLDEGEERGGWQRAVRARLSWALRNMVERWY